MPTPLKLNEALGRKIADDVRKGLFDAQIALKHDIDISTLKSWIDRGLDEEAEEPFRSFTEAYLRASIALEEEVIGTILRAADDFDRNLEATETFFGSGGDDCDSSDFEAPSGSWRKTRQQRSSHRGDWRAAAWYAERRWPLRWGITRQPEGGPKEAIRLPDAPMNRRKRVLQMTNAPPPDLVKALRDGGWDLVRREALK